MRISPSIVPLVRLACLLAVFLAPVSGQNPKPARAAEAKLAGEARIDDPATSSKLHVFSDARAFQAKATADRIECVLTMAKPFVEGMFTCVELWIDCDDKAATGLEGRELRIRAAVGSRFLPSAKEPPAGGRKPIDHCRISGTELKPNGSGGVMWLHCAVEADDPVVAGNELRFWFPRRMVRDRGDRYHGRMAMHVRVETSSSDQPIERLHVCSDEGLAIEIDGKDADWSTGRVVDPGDELHSVASCVDLTSLRVDHGVDCVFACAEFAAPGFAAWVADGDVRGVPRVTFLVEPQFPRYQDPYEVKLIGSLPRDDGKTSAGPWNGASGDRRVEVRLPRRKGQNRVRVAVLTDCELVDFFNNELKLDAEAL
jgi:hypothetical protein